RVAYRVAGNAFVSIPFGTTAGDTDLTQTTRSTEFQYQDWDGNCRIARIHQPPTATITAVNGTLLEGAAVRFSGTGSSPDGGTVSLVWPLGDGTGTATGPAVQHTFPDNGPYTVTLTPTDALGVQGAAATRTVTIANVPPTATFTATAQIFQGEA